MDQQIGIDFKTTGVDSFVRDVGRAKDSINGLVTSVDVIITKLDGFGRAMQQLNYKVGAAVRKTGAALSKLKPAMGGLEIPIGAVTGQQASPGSSVLDGLVGKALGGVTPLGLAKLALKQLIPYLRMGFKEIVLGGARADLTGLLGELSARGLTTTQLKATERMGNNFVSRAWFAGNTKDYLRGVAQAALAFDINKSIAKGGKYFKSSGEGLSQINEMSRQAMVLGVSSKMSSQDAARLLASAVHDQLSFMRKKDREAYERGDLKISKLSEKTAAGMAEILRINRISRTDVGHELTQSLAGALGKGWNMDSLLGFARAMAAAGQNGQRGGRALQLFLDGGGEAMANLMFAGSADRSIYRQWAQLDNTKRKQMAQDWEQYAIKMFSIDPIGFSGRLRDWAKTAKARGHSLKSLGIDKGWSRFFQTMTSEQFAKKWKVARQKLGPDATLQDTLKYMAADSQDIGWTLKRLSNEWKALMSTWSAIAAESAGIRGVAEGLVGVLRRFRQGLVTGDWSDLFIAMGDLLARVGYETITYLLTPPRLLLEWLTGIDITLPFDRLKKIWAEIIDAPWQKIKEVFSGALQWVKDFSISKQIHHDYKYLTDEHFRKKEQKEYLKKHPRGPRGPHTGPVAPTPKGNPWARLRRRGDSDQVVKPRNSAPGEGAFGQLMSYQPGGGDSNVNVYVRLGERELRDTVIEVLRTAQVSRGDVFGTSPSTVGFHYA